jgi:hypothetical protein
MQLAHSIGIAEIGLDARRTTSPHRGARESFSLDIPSHRIGLANDTTGWATTGWSTIQAELLNWLCLGPRLGVESFRESYMRNPCNLALM